MNASSSKGEAREDFAALFDRSKCATEGCFRQPAKRSRFCGCCRDDRREGRQVIWRAGENSLTRDFERRTREGALGHAWHPVDAPQESKPA